MALFGKKEEKNKPCCCGSCTPEDMVHAEGSKAAAGIQVLGAGCPKCKALESAVHTALTELGLSEPIDHVTDFARIAAYGVMSTPALVIDGKVVSYGKVLTSEEAKALIRKART